MARFSAQKLFLATVAAGCLAVVGYLLLTYEGRPASAIAPSAPPPKNPLDAARSFDYLKKLCDIGPRYSGSEGMLKQQAYLTEHFRALGGQVRRQEFQARHPISGDPVAMANLIVEWHPKAKRRILLCAHYDTRPFPDRDRRNPRGVFVGANDGASGVAVLMELAHHVPQLEIDYGIDFVLFDGEELVYRAAFRDQGQYFLGSEHFAREYVKQRRGGITYRWGVLLDMVGDADLQIFHERNSVTWRDTRPLVAQLWRTGARLGVREFVGRVRHEIRDDHLPLHNIGKIPACDVIDFDYPFWHTEGDTPDKCSGDSLAKVGWVVFEWLRTAR